MVQDVVDAGADVVMDADGQMVYYDSGRKALDKSDNDKVLQLKSGLPSWETLSTATLEKLGSYRAASAESSKSFTSLSLDLDADYSYLIVTVCGEASGNMALGVGLNGVT